MSQGAEIRIYTPYKAMRKERFMANFEFKDKANVAYIVAGYPNLTLTREFLAHLDESKIDILEIGIPYSDPIADGAVIFEAVSKALSGGASVHKVFELLEGVKTTKTLVFLVYYNLIFCYGLKKFVANAKKVGIQGLIVPELPYEENEELFKECQKAGIALIPLVSVTTSEERLKKILSRASGFVYALASVGITGGNQMTHKRLENLVKRIKKHTDLPVFAGFGIKDKSDVKECKRVADGAIVGTSVVQAFENGDLNEAMRKIDALF